MVNVIIKVIRMTEFCICMKKAVFVTICFFVLNFPKVDQNIKIVYYESNFHD